MTEDVKKWSVPHPDLPWWSDPIPDRDVGAFFRNAIAHTLVTIVIASFTGTILSATVADGRWTTWVTLYVFLPIVALGPVIAYLRGTVGPRWYPPTYYRSKADRDTALSFHKLPARKQAAVKPALDALTNAETDSESWDAGDLYRTLCNLYDERERLLREATPNAFIEEARLAADLLSKDIQELKRDKHDLPSPF